MSRQRKALSKFTIGLLIYIGVAVFAILIMDEFLWTGMEHYEVTEEMKELEQKKQRELKAQEMRKKVFEASPIPTLPPIIMEQVHIVKPEEAVLYVNGKPYEGDLQWTTDEDADTFASLTAITSQYEEYTGVLEGLLPTRKSAILTVEKGAKIDFLSAEGTMVSSQESSVQIDVDGEMRTIRELSCPYTNNQIAYQELTEMGFDFLTKFCLFCSNDKSASEMKPYFPADSKYYQTIASLDTSWFNGHNQPPTYTDRRVNEYVGYGNSVVYMDLRMHQSFVARWTGQRFDTEIVHPIWFVKIDGEWKIASIIFDIGEE